MLTKLVGAEEGSADFYIPPIPIKQRLPQYKVCACFVRHVLVLELVAAAVLPAPAPYSEPLTPSPGFQDEVDHAERLRLLDAELLELEAEREKEVSAISVLTATVKSNSDQSSEDEEDARDSTRASMLEITTSNPGPRAVKGWGKSPPPPHCFFDSTCMRAMNRRDFFIVALLHVHFGKTWALMRKRSKSSWSSTPDCLDTQKKQDGTN